MVRSPAHDEQVRQHVDDVGAIQLAGDADGEALACVFINDVEHPKSPTVMRPVMHEIIRPDVVRPLGAQPYARAIIQPEPLALWLLRRNLQPRTSPDPFDTLVVDTAAGAPQQFRDPAMAIATVVTGQSDVVGGQPLLIFPTARRLTLCRTVLAEHPTEPALRNAKQTPDMFDTCPSCQRHASGMT